MIVVTGTKRSGTSLWMQVLEAAGFSWIGSEWPLNWGTSIRKANEGGFYESLLRGGVYHRTNPHPHTGRFLFPTQTQRHAVKVFIPGLVRSDYAFLDHVIATIRPWGEYSRSLQRLQRLEQEHGGVAVAPKLPPEVEWWFENHALLRDIATRRYRYRLVAYDALLARPREVVQDTMDFLGGGDVDAAVEVVDQKRRTQLGIRPEEHVLDDEAVAAADALYEAIESGHALSVALLSDVNRVHRRLRETYDA